MSVLWYDSTKDLDALIELRKQAVQVAGRLIAWRAKTEELNAKHKDKVSTPADKVCRDGSKFGERFKQIPVKWPKPPTAAEAKAHDFYVASGGTLSYQHVADKMCEIYPAEGKGAWHYRSVQKAVWKVARWRAMAWAESLASFGLL